MPKIIPGLRSRILASARLQMKETGFSGLSLRNVAKQCNIAVGTTYNYFNSKADLAMNVMQEDWNTAMKEAGADTKSCQSPEEAVTAVYKAISSFTSDYSFLMHQKEAQNEYSELIARNHTRLVNDISDVLEQIFTRFGYRRKESRIRLMAVMILAAATSEDRNDEDFAWMAEKVFCKYPPLA